MRLIDADKIEYTVASVYWGKDEDGNDIYRRTAIATESEIDNAPTIDADAYFDAVDRIKACPNCRYTHIHKMFSENGQTPWKSFAEEKPNGNGRYLTYSIKESRIKEVFDLWYSEGEWYIDARGPRYEGTVTHWMRLPMGPEEVQHD